MECNETLEIEIEYAAQKLSAPNPDVVCKPSKRPPAVKFLFKSDVQDMKAYITQVNHDGDPDTAFKEGALGSTFTIDRNSFKEGTLKDGNPFSHKIYKYTIEAGGQEIDPVIIIEPTFHNAFFFLLFGVAAVASLFGFLRFRSGPS